MNGSLHSSSNVVDIKLKRGPAGLGFNIVGGVDQQYVVNDNGIYVSKIKEDGSAALDGRLQEGDKILAINGEMLDNRTHKAAVELFRSAGENVELKVLKKHGTALPVNRHGHSDVIAPHLTNGPTGSQPEHESSFSSLGTLAVLAGAATIIAFIYMRKHF